jgi:hypothetical protein
MRMDYLDNARAHLDSRGHGGRWGFGYMGEMGVVSEVTLDSRNRQRG